MFGIRDDFGTFYDAWKKDLTDCFTNYVHYFAQQQPEKIIRASEWWSSKTCKPGTVYPRALESYDLNSDCVTVLGDAVVQLGHHTQKMCFGLLFSLYFGSPRYVFVYNKKLAKIAVDPYLFPLSTHDNVRRIVRSVSYENEPINPWNLADSLHLNVKEVSFPFGDFEKSRLITRETLVPLRFPGESIPKRARIEHKTVLLSKGLTESQKEDELLRCSILYMLLFPFLCLQQITGHHDFSEQRAFQAVTPLTQAVYDELRMPGEKCRSMLNGRLQGHSCTTADVRWLADQCCVSERYARSQIRRIMAS